LDLQFDRAIGEAPARMREEVSFDCPRFEVLVHLLMAVAGVGNIEAKGASLRVIFEVGSDIVEGRVKAGYLSFNAVARVDPVIEGAELTRLNAIGPRKTPHRSVAIFCDPFASFYWDNVRLAVDEDFT